MKDGLEADPLFEKAKAAFHKAIKTVANAASAVAVRTKNRLVTVAGNVADALERKRNSAREKRKAHFESAMLPLSGTEAEAFIATLGASPLELADSKNDQLQSAFPIPREHLILWADAEFDLRPSGIAVTNRGVFIRTNAGLLDGKIMPGNFKLDGLTPEEQQAFLQHRARFHSGKAVLLYYSWGDFDARWFTGDTEMENKALLVEPQCAGRFVEACRRYCVRTYKTENDGWANPDWEDCHDESVSPAGVVAGAAVESSQTAVFAEHKARTNTPTGHGEMAEEANNWLDRLQGLDAKVTGRDNAKDGADRQIGDILIQTKYYNSARDSLEACFHSETGQYRYMNDGKPMQLEVPKDQYPKVLEGFQKKIEAGNVPGVTDPREAAHIVREGRLTYQQAVNLTKPGTIESLSYDALTGAVTCSCAFGITFVATVFLTWRKTDDFNQAIQSGASAGLQIFGLSFIQHIFVSQVARTGFARTLLKPSQYVVERLGTKTSATIVNSIRALSGESAIYGASASKHLAKILRSNVLTSVLSLAVFSIPDTYHVAIRKISGAQYIKNMSVLAGSIAAGAGGAVATGVAAAKIAGVAGTTVAPGVGTVAGIAGGFVGGVVGSKVVKVVADILHEDDTETLGRLFNAYVSCMMGEYLLDEPEIDTLIDRLNEIEPNEFKALFHRIAMSPEQETVVRSFLTPYFDAIVAERSRFSLPSAESMLSAMANLN